ncbi:hypothetical protein P7C70_g5352, partial [Phenoliferia sp. Uapishka_3]
MSELPVPRPRFSLAPGLGAGGHAFHSHLPTIHGVYYARCRFCYYETSRHVSAADATRHWRNRHAAVHGIKSWDLGLFHPSLPFNIIPPHVARTEGTGLVYFANRLRARRIFEYSDLIAESRHNARVFARLTQPLRSNESWRTSMIPADEVALLYRRTRHTPTVTARRDPDDNSVEVDEFRGVALSGFNTHDSLLVAVGTDFDPVSLGSLLWFWIFGARAVQIALVAAKVVDGDDEVWEEYRQALYETMWHYTLHVAGYEVEPTNESIPFDFSLFQTSALPSHPPTPLQPASTVALPLDVLPNTFFAELTAKISHAAAQNVTDARSEVEVNAAEEWKTLLENDGLELRKWNHSGAARDEHEAKTGWPRVVEVWCTLSPAERASWCQRKDPARTSPPSPPHELSTPLPPLIPIHTPSRLPSPSSPGAPSNKSIHYFTIVTSFQKVNMSAASPDIVSDANDRTSTPALCSPAPPAPHPSSEASSDSSSMTDTEVEDVEEELESAIPHGRRLKRKVVSSDPIEAATSAPATRRRGFGNLLPAPPGRIVPPPPSFNRSQPFGPPRHYNHRPAAREVATGTWVQIVAPTSYRAFLRSTDLEPMISKVWVDFDPSGALPPQWLSDPVGSFHAQQAARAADAVASAALVASRERRANLRSGVRCLTGGEEMSTGMLQ